MKARAWPWPVALGMLTAGGLLSALCGDGVWDVLSWLALVGVLVVSLRHVRGAPSKP